ncbi:hypothetical protein [uncultured Deinococcus sp.]|uniref:hypothetical protein n=1 Tax=uncultured Deinococcus sp. TaxID=158789 RepID=UPI003748F91B
MSHNWQATHSALGEPIYVCTQCRQQYTGLDLRQWFTPCAGPDTSAYHAALIRYARGEGSRAELRALNPDRETIRKHAEMMADEYAKGKR